jgi:hypothetical protein
MGNRIGKEQLAKLQEIMRSKPNLVSLCGIADGATEADLSGLEMDADGAAILASELPDKGALSVLSLKSNKLLADGGKALAEGLKGNTVITELDISSNDLGVGSDYMPDISGVIALANIIPDMRALSVLSLKDNRLATKEGGKALAQALANNSALKELDVSSNIWKDEYGNCEGDGPGFAQELAVGVKDNGALLVLSLKGNFLYAEGGEALAAGLQGNQGITELNISSNNLGWKDRFGKVDMSGVIALANAIPDMGALLVLNLASNNLFAEGIELLAEALKGNQIMTELNVSDNAATWDGNKPGEMSGVIALADAIPDMRAMTSLNLASNALCGLDKYGRGTFDATGIWLCQHLSCLT